jgi:hypothetical protein
MTVTRDRENKTIAIDQMGYINRILERFEMANTTPKTVPLDPGFKPHKLEPNEVEFDPTTYQNAIGSLLYAALGTRPDIAYAIAVLGRYASMPSTLHWNAVKNVFRYFVGTNRLKLTLYDGTKMANQSSSVICSADADLGGDIETSRSTTGLVLHAMDILVGWKSKRQSTAAQSTMEAEMLATAMGKQQMDWLKDVIHEIKPTITSLGGEVKIQYDKKTTI